MSMPRGRGGRALKLMGMTASVASAYASTRVGNVFRGAKARARAEVDAQRRAGERIAETLGSLKGAAMKLGQMASTNADVLPPEVAQALVALQSRAPAMDESVIREVIEAELGGPPEHCFAEFSREPCAAASMGQVHRATTLEGVEVAVKVQYPGMRDTVESDIRQVELALRMGAFAVPKAAMRAMSEELRARLFEELDYRHEARNMLQAKRDASVVEGLRVPEVFEDRSTGRVLTMEWLEGTSLSELAAPDGSGRERLAAADRDLLGERLFRFILHGFFTVGRLHGDPNPANFARGADGELIVYDFGLVRHYDAAYREAVADLLRAVALEDASALDGALVAMGARRPDKAAPPLDVYRPWMDMFAPGLRRTGPRELQYAMDFGAVKDLVPTMLRHLAAFQPTPELGVLKRVWTGHAENLGNLGARVDPGALFAEFVEGLESR